MLSVVIPAYNEEKNIARCLDALVQQTTQHPFEVVVVNNASTDQTAAIALHYRDRLSVTVIDDPIKGRGHARYVGFLHAKGNIILSTDADAYVPPHWIEHMARTFECNPNIVAVTTACTIVDCDTRTNEWFNYLQPRMMHWYRFIFRHYWLSGFSFGITRGAYDASGGFDPDLNVQEDIDLSFKVSRIGEIYFIPDLTVVFSGRRFQKGLIRGLWPYIMTFMQWSWLKNRQVHLGDVR